MKSKVRSALLFVVLFVLAASSLFAQTRSFTAANIAVTLEDAGTGGIVLIGTKVKVELTDPDLANPTLKLVSATVNFTEFGGVAEAVMTWYAGESKWKADYTVTPGNLNNILANVKVTGTTANGNDHGVWDETEFTVNNIPATIGALNINTTLSNAGTTGKAIIGSTITVSFTSADIATAEVDFTDFGGSIVNMTKTSNTFTGSYTVSEGAIANQFKAKVYAYVTGNLNPGVVLDDVFTPINNKRPTSAEILSSHLRVNNLPNLTFFKIGDVLYVKGTLKTAGDTAVNKIWIDWAASGFVNGEVLAYNVSGGAFTAVFTPDPGGINHTDSLKVKIVKLQTVDGNFSNAAFSYWVAKNGNNPAQHIVADLMPPSIVGVQDIFYDMSVPLRFSPNVAAVDSFTTAPHQLKIMLKIPNWGLADGARSFKLRFTSENREEFFITYGINDTLSNGDLVVTNAGGGNLSLYWDGKNAGQIVSLTAETTYGITLWDIYDEVGNPAIITHVSGDEYLGAHHAIYQGGDVFEGSSILNRIHAVVDNVNPAFVTGQNLALMQTADATINRMINDLDGDGVWDAAEDAYYAYANGATTDADGNPVDSAIKLKFKTQRISTVDSND
ncbi:MAG: hypothetical protein PHO32_07970, partial [Candidatus Cloacimonetes bacterium]|nr:hypothetical protein [Candidatus Cloacimonadota bacterium]